MSKKRSKTAENRSLRTVVHAQLAAAAEEIYRLLKESRRPGMELTQPGTEQLRRLVMQLITAAVNNIFTAFEASRAADREPEDPGEERGAEPAGQSPDKHKHSEYI